MVSLKYSVGITNKFGDLNLENDSSEDESVLLNIASQTISSDEAMNSSTNDHSPLTNTDKKISEDHSNKQTSQTPSTMNSSTSHTKSKTKTSYQETNQDKDDKTLNRSNRNSEKISKPKKFEKSNFKKENSNSQTQGYNDNNASKFSERKFSKPSASDTWNESSKSEDKSSENMNIEKEKSEVEESKKQTNENSESPPTMMDLEEWKIKQASKRANLPNASAKSNNPFDNTKKFEAQGMTRYVKHSATKKNTEASPDEYPNENTNQKKKSSQKVNYYEFSYNETGQLNLFQGLKRRGRRNTPRTNRIESTEKPKHTDYKERDAPDLQDTRAFPSLGDAKVVS